MQFDEAEMMSTMTLKTAELQHWRMHSATLLGGSFEADGHEATLPRNYCMQPCYATYAMSNHDVQRLHGKRCTRRLPGKVAPCLSALTEHDNLEKKKL